MKHHYFTFSFTVVYCSQIQTDQLEVDAAIKQVQDNLDESTKQITVIELPCSEEPQYYNFATREGPSVGRCLDLDEEGFGVSIELVYDTCYTIEASSKEQALKILRTKKLQSLLTVIDDDSKKIGAKYGLTFGHAYCDIA